MGNHQSLRRATLTSKRAADLFECAVATNVHLLLDRGSDVHRCRVNAELGSRAHANIKRRIRFDRVLTVRWGWSRTYERRGRAISIDVKKGLDKVWMPVTGSGQQRSAALVLSRHVWEANRQSGLHKLAELYCLRGLDVDLATFGVPIADVLRPWIWNEKVSGFTLVRGKRYLVHGCRLYNFTSPSLTVPGPMQRLLPESLIGALELTTIPPLLRRIQRLGRAYNFIAFDSSVSIRWYEQLRRVFPSAKIVYRPSDPLHFRKTDGRIQRAERLLLKEADTVLFVNEQRVALCARAYPELDLSGPQYHIVPNGVDVEPFTRQWPRPAEYRDRPVAAYLGVSWVWWDMVFHCARELPEVDFCIVSPTRPSRDDQRELRNYENVIYIPGVPPEDVPRYLTNCDVCMVPYINNPMLETVGMHAKLLQAMAARRPIVASHLSRDFEQYGVAVSNDPNEFIAKLREALKTGTRDYDFDLQARSWTRVQDAFARAMRLNCVDDNASSDQA